MTSPNRRRTIHQCSAASIVLALVLAAWGAAAFGDESLSERVASYRIEARLEPAAHRVVAHQVLRWSNTTRRPARDLCLHFYLNAFSGNKTSLMEALPEAAREWARNDPNGWGGLDVTAIRIGDAEVTKQLEFVRPDDGNPYDRTLARLPLARAVPPGGTLEVEFDFVAQLPRLFKRAGHAAPFFLVAQWFPKVGVFRDGAWRCHQYQRNTEFFADFGRYDVSLTVPAGYVVGHTGVETAERTNEDGTRTIDVVAEDVHDFAWAADPRFRVVARSLGGVAVRLLVQPQHLAQAERYLHALDAAMARYASWFGRYPYPVLTLVDPGPGGAPAAGMEYPMLITVGTTWWMPRAVRLPEMLTVHEFGHQYWYGMVANDEVRAPWLDEGINSFVEGRIMDDTYGEGSYVDLLGLKIDAVAQQRLRYLVAPRFDAVETPADQFVDSESYASTAYAKTALALETLDRLLGGGRLTPALREYFQRWRFRHPQGEDFVRVVEESTGEDLDWFFRQALGGTAVLDYAIARLDVHKVRPLAGRGVAAPETGPARYRAEVVVERRGDFRVPVDVVVVFDDGSETRQSWDGEERWHRLDITSTERASYAVVDPDDKLPLDANRLNNSRLRSSGTRGVIRIAGRWGLWLQGALHFLSGF